MYGGCGNKQQMGGVGKRVDNTIVEMMAVIKSKSYKGKNNAQLITGPSGNMIRVSELKGRVAVKMVYDYIMRPVTPPAVVKPRKKKPYVYKMKSWYQR
jgi:hypothetical protein